MRLAIIGLGRMGLNMARRLLEGGHGVVVYNRGRDKVDQMVREGAVGAASLEDLVHRLSPPRVAWLMLPAGPVTDQHLDRLAELLEPGDLIVDGANGRYREARARAERLRARGLRFLDAGVSGGIWGLKEGYCIMVGGEAADFELLEPALKTLAPPGGYHLCGPAGAGHFVKMVHNGVEYALMEAYGEGFELLKASPFGLDLAAVARLWGRGSVVRSWLLDLLASALARDPDLASIRGFVEDSGEGRWSVQEAVDLGVGAEVIAQSLFKRFESRQAETFSNKVLAALRKEFGGHPVKPDRPA